MEPKRSENCEGKRLRLGDRMIEQSGKQCISFLSKTREMTRTTMIWATAFYLNRYSTAFRLSSVGLE
ncbi:hypothetical protein QWZ16_19900 [Vibrio ostreicida]|uniref:Uncharacterized protein n=1 Tax=Vibrio ostreicida TaxID=526588 RepID=A0ABT8BYG3_9VIBR|nr:hypothetical protein [Vibrio ostreicida]MDN3611862.1 hypothetical protein [Vibrio ostreicida]